MKFAPSATSLISPAKFHCRGGINDAIVIKELRASDDDRREGRWSGAWTSSGLQLSAQAEWTFSRLQDQILFLSLNLFDKFALWPRWEISFFFLFHVIFQEHLQLTASRENKIWCKVGSGKYVQYIYTVYVCTEGQGEVFCLARFILARAMETLLMKAKLSLRCFTVETQRWPGLKKSLSLHTLSTFGLDLPENPRPLFFFLYAASTIWDHHHHHHHHCKEVSFCN